jgi:ring-1,2-phenylacetyl-CoA epoxidase subunit PaaA
MLQLNPNNTGIGNVTAETFFAQDNEFTKLQLNIIAIHVVSEEFGADTFEQSILRAPTADLKMRMAKTVMEEYGHHLRFRKLLEDLKLDWKEVTKDKGHLTTFDVPIDTWADQMVFLALVDRAAAHQFRHFIKSPYEPFRRACQETLNEEYGHVGLGMDGVKDLLRTAEGRAEVEQAVHKWLPVGLASFGGDKSRTNERFRHWGLKSHTNEGMRETYYQQVKAFITQDWGVPLPDTSDAFITQLGGSLTQHAIYVAG